jgi:hypothetical protein
VTGLNPREAIVHAVKKLIPLGAVLASVIGVIGAAAAPASAAPVYAKNGNYQFASYTPATSGNFIVSNKPLSYSDAAQSLGANGVNLSASGGGDSGVIVPLGHLSSLFNDGTYVPPAIVGNNLEGYNLYFDTSADSTYFGWAQDGSIDPYIMTSLNHDTAASMGQVNNDNDQADFTTFASEPGASDLNGTLTGTMTMQQVRAAYANAGRDPLVWAWIGVGDGATTGPGYVTSVNGNSLVSTYAAPVTGLKVTPGYTSLTATWKGSSGATGYQVKVTQHNGSVTIASPPAVTGTSIRIGHLKAKNTYAVKVLALPAAPGQKPVTVYTTTR